MLNPNDLIFEIAAAYEPFYKEALQRGLQSELVLVLRGASHRRN